MAIVMLIKEETIRENIQYLDDIVGVFADDHPFTPSELAQFNFLTLNGSVSDVWNVLHAIFPEIYDAYEQSDHTYTFDPSSDIIGSIEVWRPQGSNKWYQYINKFKFRYNVGTLTPEEKQLAETYDITHPSVQSFINKITKDISSDPANNLEVRDLKNTEPV